MTEVEQSLVEGTDTETSAEKRGHRVRGVLSLRMVREVALTVGAIAGVLCLVSAIAAMAFEVTPVVFRSGSMAPAINTGALALSRTVDASELRVGDVVTVKTGAGVRVTHRIQDISLSGDKATMVLKGDANGAVDDRAYVVTSAPRVLFDIPKLGYVVSFTSGPVGIFAGGLLVGLVLLTVFRPGATTRSGVPGTGRAGTVVAVVATLAVGGTVAGTFSGSQTLAYYTDSATATSGTFSRPAPLPPSAPVISGCTTGGSSLTLTWTAPVDPNSFEMRFASSPSKPSESISGSSRQHETNANLNNTAGQVWIVAINANGTSLDSVHYAFAGNGSNRTCEPVG